jgi:hypothetical protein
MALITNLAKAAAEFFIRRPAIPDVPRPAPLQPDEEEAGVASVMVDHAGETETGHAGGTQPLLQERRELACANGGEQTSWNQQFAADGYCPYCGTINWERNLDFDWDEERQECKCELCGAEWWEVLTPTPKKPVLDPGISAVSN